MHACNTFEQWQYTYVHAYMHTCIHTYIHAYTQVNVNDCLLIGKEMVKVVSVKGPLFVVKRGTGGTDASKHTSNIKVMFYLRMQMCMYVMSPGPGLLPGPGLSPRLSRPGFVLLRKPLTASTGPSRSGPSRPGFVGTGTPGTLRPPAHL